MEVKAFYQLVANPGPIYSLSLFHPWFVAEDIGVPVTPRSAIGFFKIVDGPVEFRHGFLQAVAESLRAPVLRLHGREYLQMALQTFIDLLNLRLLPLHGFQLLVYAPYRVVELHAYFIQCVVEQQLLLRVGLQLPALRFPLYTLCFVKLHLLPRLLDLLPHLLRRVHFPIGYPRVQLHLSVGNLLLHVVASERCFGKVKDFRRSLPDSRELVVVLKKAEARRALPGSGGIRATGIEPVSHAWEARVLPLNDARMWCAEILQRTFYSVKQK